MNLDISPHGAILELHWVGPDARRELFGACAKTLRLPETARKHFGNLSVVRGVGESVLNLNHLAYGTIIRMALGRALSSSETLRKVCGNSAGSKNPAETMRLSAVGKFTSNLNNLLDAEFLECPWGGPDPQRRLFGQCAKIQPRGNYAEILRLPAA